MWLCFILRKLSGKTVIEERCLASLQEVTKSNKNLGDNKSRGGEGQPERIAAKMLITVLLCYLCYRRRTRSVLLQLHNFHFKGKINVSMIE